MTPIAAAQDAPEARELTPDERARELYLRGDRMYAEGSYDEAVVAFEQAYELSRQPVLLYDMANALERLGRYEEALHRLSQYVPSAPEHQRDTVLKRIRSLESRAEERRRHERSWATVPATAAPAGLPEAASARIRLAEPIADRAAPAPILGYAIGGAGVASIGVGIVFAVAASSERGDAEARCVDRRAGVFCPASVEAQLSAADGRALAADIALGVGLVALGVGTYLVLSHDPDSGSTAALRAGADPSGGRVSLVTTF